VPAPRTYTDREVFEGLAFGHGPVAEAIPELRALDVSWSSRRQRAADAIETAIGRQNQTFMRSFAKDVESGDPGRVAIAMSRMNRALVGVAHDSMTSDVSSARGRFANGIANGADGVLINLAVSVTAAVLVLPQEDLAQTRFSVDEFDKSVAMYLRTSTIQLAQVPETFGNATEARVAAKPYGSPRKSDMRARFET
jgi:SdpC family antimicrobial peptide